MTINPPGIVVTAGPAARTFVPTDTPLVGLNYFDGRFLRAADLNQEHRAQRAYVEFANRAGGPGVAHGFDVSRRSDTRLGLSAGLAVDPQGRLLYLPEAVEADVTALLTPALDSPVEETPSVGFTPCAHPVAAASGTVVGTTMLYLVCLAQAQQLCGETEVFGRLCADACVTPTDAPYLVDGVTLSLRPLVLSAPLPALPGITRPEVHLRSQVAAAYFAEEWQQGGSLLSAAELGLRRWCAGAPPAAGAPLAGADVVPLAVLGWNGAQITLLDGWTARRERMTAPPRSYWDGRLELRPWPVFLAQVLQFQCQLADLREASPAALRHAVDPDQPGDPTRALLKRSAQVIDELMGELSRAGRPSATARTSDLFKARVTEALKAGPSASSSAQVLLANGFVELPPAGYLPVDLSTGTPLRRQLENLLGPGVDLRLCTVRQDQIAHELERATHMRRISLLHGIEHPDAREPVDVLVPDGTLHTADATRTGVGFAVDIDVSGLNDQQPSRERLTHPVARIDGQPPLYGAARAEPGPAVEATVVACGAVQDRVEALIRQIIRQSALPVRPHASLAATITGMVGLNLGTTAPSMSKVRDVAHRAKRLGARVSPLPQGPGEQVAATLLSLWIPVDPFTLPQLDSAPFNATFEITLPGPRPMSMTRRLDGQIQRGPDRAGAPEEEVVLELRGCVETSTSDINHRRVNRSFSETLLARRMMLEGYEVLAATDESVRVVAAVAWKGSPVDARGLLLDLRRVKEPDALVATLSAALRRARLPKGTRQIFAVDGTEDPTIPKPENEYHAAAVAALQKLSELHPDDTTYVKRGVRRLFPPRAPTSAEVRATKDWVLFRRRHHERCEGPVDVPSVAPSRVAVWLVRAVNEEQAQEMEALLRRKEGEEIAWQQVDVVEFEQGTTNLLTTSAAWRRRYTAASGANTIRFAGYGAAPGSVTAPVGVCRARALVDACAGVATLADDGVVDLVVHPPAGQLITGTDASIFLVTYEVRDCIQVIVVDACGEGGDALAEAVRTGNVDGVDQAGDRLRVLADIDFSGDPDPGEIFGQIGNAFQVRVFQMREQYAAALALSPVAWTRVPPGQPDRVADHVRCIPEGLRQGAGEDIAEWQDSVLKSVEFTDEGCPTRLYLVLTPTQIG
ncbi:hypothetical protein AB0J14_28140 [Micromonospora arborensis]|uniref:hypothetical protein n=1 Tax=Micromonospora arborensis TaxID=2116518 RepID=UPI003402CDE3